MPTIEFYVVGQKVEHDDEKSQYMYLLHTHTAGDVHVDCPQDEQVMSTFIIIINEGVYYIFSILFKN